jgi:hypothetical protein
MFNGGTMFKCACGRASHAGPICPKCLKGIENIREVLTKAFAERGVIDPAKVDALMRHIVDAIEREPPMIAPS